MGDLSNDHPFNSRQSNLIAVTTFCIVISTIAVALRLLARRQFHIKLWWDDYIAVIALVFSYFPNVTTIMGVKAGLGRHTADVTHPQAKYIGITVYVHQITWFISFTAIIVTILILYIRIFPNPWLQRASRASIYFSTLWMIINIIVLTFQCTPVEFFWDHTRAGGGHCIHLNQYYAIACAISMVMLNLVFLMPLPIVRKLQINSSKKWGLGLAFGVGGFACVASVMRLVLVLEIVNSDMMWSIAPAVLWGCLEVSIGVVSSCIPSLMPLFLSFVGWQRGSKVSGNRGYVKYENGNKIKTSTSRTNRFNRFMSLRDLDTLPEGLDLFTIKDDAVKDDHDLKLVAAREQPGEILVTNQILVSDDVPKSMETDSEDYKPWDVHAPPTAHLR